MTDQIRQVLTAYGKLPVDVASLGDSADLYQAGLTSHATVNVMLGLENEFDIEFPQEMLRKRTFESVDAIREALDALVVPAAR